METPKKVALVTGSATGIGEAIARRLSAGGLRVVLHGQEHERAAGQEFERQLKAAGGEAIFVAAQLEDPAACAALVAEAAAAWGRLDVLVNNAASVVRSNLHTTDAVLFDATMAVNVRAPMLLIQAAHPWFVAAGGGRVLNIGSVNGLCGEANQLAYSISKGALITLTRNLADALATEGIRVNQMNLGWVLTANEYALKQREGLPPDWPSQVPTVYAPSGRLISPQEVAHYAHALLCDEAGVISGIVMELEQYPMVGRNPVKQG